MNLNENPQHLHPEKQNTMYHFTNHPMYHQNAYTQPCPMFIDHTKHSITAHNTHVITHNTPTIAHHIQVTNHHTQGTAHNTPTTAHYTQATAHNTQAPTHSLQTAIRHTQAIVHNTQANNTHHIQATAHNTQPTIHNTQPIVHNTHPTAHNTQSITLNTQPTALNTQLTAHNTQPITHSPQPSAHNIQPTIHNIQPTEHNTQPTTRNTQTPINNTQNSVHTTQSTANNIQNTAHNTQSEIVHEKETPESQIETVTATHKNKAEVKVDSETLSTKSDKKIKIVGKSKNSVDTSHFTIEERLIAAVWVHERKNIKKSMRQLNHDFHQRFGRKPPAKNTLLGWERKLFSTGCLEDAPRTGRPVKRRSRVEEVAASVRAAPALSLRARALALRVPTTTLHTILRRDLAQPANTTSKTPTKKSPKKTKPAKRKPNETVNQPAQAMNAPLSHTDTCHMFTDSMDCQCTKCELLTN